MPALPCRDCGRPIQVPRGITTAYHGDCLESLREAWKDASPHEREQLRVIAAQITARRAAPEVPMR